MKTQIGLYVSVETADELRARARTVGASIGDLADLLLRFGLERMSADALRAWAVKQPSTLGRNAGALGKNEKAVFGAMEVLHNAAEGAWRFSGDEIASSAGLRLSQAFWALKALKARGLVHGMELEEVDRWGRPVKSFWSIKDRMPAVALSDTRPESVQARSG